MSFRHNSATGFGLMQHSHCARPSIYLSFLMQSEYFDYCIPRLPCSPPIAATNTDTAKYEQHLSEIAVELGSEARIGPYCTYLCVNSLHPLPDCPTPLSSLNDHDYLRTSFTSASNNSTCMLLLSDDVLEENKNRLFPQSQQPSDFNHLSSPPSFPQKQY